MSTCGTVFIVDDNDDFRVSTAWMLKGEGYQTVEFACPRKAINALSNSEPESLKHCCILLDVRMPGMTGLEFHDNLRSRKFSIPIVYMTGHGDVPLAVEAMKKGAVTMLEKPLKPEQLNAAIESAMSQSATPKTIEKLVDVSTVNRGSFIELMSALTPREEQVMNGMVHGKANKVIGIELGISVRTVEAHRARLMKKLNVQSVSELIKMVMLCQSNT